MSFILRRSEKDGGGYFSTGPVRPHSMGDGGFMAAGEAWEHRPSGAIFVAWDVITGWSFSLEATGTNIDTKNVEVSK